MKNSHFEIPGRVVEYRKRAGLTQKELARASTIRPRRMGIIERGEVSPTMGEVAAVAAALDVPFLDLVYGEGSGLIDLSDMWPEHRRTVELLVESLREDEKAYRDDWEAFSREVMRLDKIPPSPRSRRRRRG